MAEFLDRYRELGSTPEAALQVRMECEKNAERHWHRLYERCWCGFLGVPSKFYEYKEGKQVSTQNQAEEAFLAFVGTKDTSGDVPAETVPTANVPTCEECHKNPKEGRCRTCSACRKRAYRERSR